MNKNPQLWNKVKARKTTISKASKKLGYEKERQRVRDTKPVIDLPDDIKLIHGPFQEKGKEIADNSIDLILTDPFYANKYLYLYKDLGVFPARVLKPGGSLVTFGAYLLIESGNLIAESGLKYVHTFAVIHKGQCGKDFPNNIRLKYKPYIMVCKRRKTKHNSRNYRGCHLLRTTG